jgi:hypothetical protein
MEPTIRQFTGMMHHLPFASLLISILSSINHPTIQTTPSNIITNELMIVTGGILNIIEKKSDNPTDINPVAITPITFFILFPQ